MSLWARAGRRRRRLLAVAWSAAGAAGASLAACAVPGRPGGAPAGSGRPSGGAPGGAPGGAEVVLSERDAATIRERLAWARREGVQRLPPGEAVVKLGETFLGVPYAANTLEAPGPERLVVDLTGFDCVTFVETALVLARLARGAGAPAGHGGDAAALEAYAAELRRLRYRRGTLDGYASRLHYFSEWIADNAAKGLVGDVGEALGGRRLTRPVDYMSAHPEAYPRLEDAATLAAVRQAEVALSARPRFAVPRARLAEVAPRIENGDVIAVTTSVPGLDVTHTGLATRVGDRLHLLHAPAPGRSVEVSTLPLAEWLARDPAQEGIMVARPR
jgi:hypothetical protein